MTDEKGKKKKRSRRRKTQDETSNNCNGVRIAKDTRVHLRVSASAFSSIKRRFSSSSSSYSSFLSPFSFGSSRTIVLSWWVFTHKHSLIHTKCTWTRQQETRMRMDVEWAPGETMPLSEETSLSHTHKASIKWWDAEIHVCNRKRGKRKRERDEIE